MEFTALAVENVRLGFLYLRFSCVSMTPMGSVECHLCCLCCVPVVLCFVLHGLMSNDTQSKMEGIYIYIFQSVGCSPLQLFTLAETETDDAIR